MSAEVQREAEELTPERIQEYLAQKLPEREALEVTRLHRIVGGMSRETWFVDITWHENGAAAEERLTLRLNHPAGSVIPVPLWWEFRTLAGLHGTDVPVAKPFWYEEDPKWLGRAPFYFRELVEGEASPKYLYAPGAEKRRAHIGRHFAKLLARVHLVDWKAAGLDSFMAVPKDARDCALLELSRWEEHYEANRVEPKPIMAEIFSWLKANAPEDVSRVSVVWGDVGVGNFIYRGDEIVALSDWEQSHLGDPMKDWASALWRGVDSLLPREELFAIYEQESGIPIRQESIDYYTAFYCTECVCTSHPVLKDLIGDNTADVTFARLGLGIPWYCIDYAYTTMGH